MYWPSPQVKISKDLCEELEKLARNRSTPKKLAQRCWMILMGAEGISNYAIARTLNVSRPTVILWRMRFEVFGKTVLLDESAGVSGRPNGYSGEQREEIRAEAKAGSSIRQLGQQFGVSKSTVQRILKE